VSGWVSYLAVIRLRVEQCTLHVIFSRAHTRLIVTSSTTPFQSTTELSCSDCTVTERIICVTVHLNSSTSSSFQSQSDVLSILSCRPTAISYADDHFYKKVKSCLRERTTANGLIELFKSGRVSFSAPPLQRARSITTCRAPPCRHVRTVLPAPW
jgi:hypothetical protein